MAEPLNRRSCVCEPSATEVYAPLPEGTSELPPAALAVPAAPAAPAAKAATPPASLCERPIGQDAFSMTDAGFAGALKQLQAMPFGQRIACIKDRFLGLPYLLDSHGEGEGSFIDTDPMVRFDAFDCMTYVMTVMALASSETPEEFERHLREINYRDGIATYAARNHFVEGRGGWLARNEAEGWLRDITGILSGDMLTVRATIDMMGWMMAKEELTREEKEAAAADLRVAGLDKPEEAAMNAIPLSAFLAVGAESQGPGGAILALLPEISIMLLLRHEKDAQAVGVIVAHMAFVVVPRNADGTRGTPMIVHGSSRAGILFAEPLLPYLASQLPFRSGALFLELLEK